MHGLGTLKYQIVLKIAAIITTYSDRNRHDGTLSIKNYADGASPWVQWPRFGQSPEIHDGAVSIRNFVLNKAQLIISHTYLYSIFF
jgi:hypothetical protein